MTKSGEKSPLEKRDSVWEFIRRKEDFDAFELAAFFGLDRDMATAYVLALKKEGYLQKTENQSIIPFDWATRYRLVKDSSKPPRVRLDGTPLTGGKGMRQMWNAMRILGKFDLKQLLAHSSGGGHVVAQQEAQTYLYYLEKAGYVRRLSGNDPDSPTFLLVRSKWGPQPPVILKEYQVFDPNTKKTVWSSRANGDGEEEEL